MENNMNCKNKPKKCESHVCCKATAALDAEVQSDMNQPDKSLSSLLNKNDAAASGELPTDVN